MKKAIGYLALAVLGCSLFIGPWAMIIKGSNMAKSAMSEQPEFSSDSFFDPGEGWFLGGIILHWMVSCVWAAAGLLAPHGACGFLTILYLLTSDGSGGAATGLIVLIMVPVIALAETD